MVINPIRPIKSIKPTKSIKPISNNDMSQNKGLLVLSKLNKFIGQDVLVESLNKDKLKTYEGVLINVDFPINITMTNGEEVYFFSADECIIKITTDQERTVLFDNKFVKGISATSFPNSRLIRKSFYNDVEL